VGAVMAVAGLVKILMAFWTVCSRPQTAGTMTMSQAMAMAMRTWDEFWTEAEFSADILVLIASPLMEPGGAVDDDADRSSR
jgi:hypothetical protein